MILLLVFAFLVSLSMPESSVEIWGMMLMGKNKALDLGLCSGSDPGLVPEIYVSFCFI